MSKIIFKNFIKDAIRNDAERVHVASIIGIVSQLKTPNIDTVLMCGDFLLRSGDETKSCKTLAGPRVLEDKVLEFFVSGKDLKFGVEIFGQRKNKRFELKMTEVIKFTNVDQIDELVEKFQKELETRK